MRAPDSPTHFLTGAELDAGRLDLRLHRAGALKEKPLSSRALERRAVALIFQKPSTRTRTSFEVGVFELALHCLPAHPGEGITEEDLYGDRQRIWFQAENRRHAQKALLELLVSPAAEDG